MIEPVYILIRTSNRPIFFARMMETIKNQTYKNIVTIVHTDDPCDKYVTGDIIIRGNAFPSRYGDGAYNLYNNRLLDKIPKGSGWYHFIDDDDEYASDDVIERLIEASKRDHVNVARVQRWNQSIWPKKWGLQKSFQTECFFLHTDHKSKSKWWGNKGGDHYYSKQLTRILPINWIDKLLICKAQEGKGNGNKLDAGNKRVNYNDAFNPDEEVPVLGLINLRKEIRYGEIKYMKFGTAIKLQKENKVKITYPGILSERPPVREILNIR